MQMHLALYQPDIPQNAGTILRMAACLNVTCRIIAPAGFDVSDRALKRAGLDYLGMASIIRHESFDAFNANRLIEGRRLILLTTSGHEPYITFSFRPDDVLLVGRESAGVPESVHEAADARLVIPMKPGLRSLNVAVAAAMVLGEALRQTNQFALFETATEGKKS